METQIKLEEEVKKEFDALISDCIQYKDNPVLLSYFYFRLVDKHLEYYKNNYDVGYFAERIITEIVPLMNKNYVQRW